MDTSPRPPQREESPLKRFGQTIRRAFVEFLRFPLLVVAVFLMLAAATTALDYTHFAWLEPTRDAIRIYLFRDAKATSGLLATIAGSIITVTSITFSLLLLAVQQAAAALTPSVYDQFLRRRINQLYFGFFVGLALYTLLILATVNPPYNPVFGATLDLLLTLIALVLIILLLYTTVNQMRPVVVINTIHDHILAARECQRELLTRTRRTPRHDTANATPVRSIDDGYVVGLDIAKIAEAVKQTHGEIEIALSVYVGQYVAFRDTLARVWTASPQDAQPIARAVLAAIRLERQRDLESDPAYGIEHLAIIGWTCVSTAKSNPAPGALVLHSLRDVLARWSVDDRDPDSDIAPGDVLPLVYDDNVFTSLLDSFETLAVVASESMQPQTLSEFLRCFAVMFARLPAARQARAENLIRSSLSTLGEHVLTGELDAALSALQDTLVAADRGATAEAVRAAHEELRSSLGKLGSRATRGTHGNHAA